MDMKTANQRVTEFEFGTCIAEHNLEDENGNLLDFKRPAHVAILDSRVGDEIAEAIDKMHSLEDETAGN
jgi:hypothetical protein